MIIQGECKLCRAVLSVECDDDYAELGDPFSLARMLTCNGCYDLRHRRERLHEAIYRACVNVMHAPAGKRQEAIAHALDGMTRLTQKYAKWFQDFSKGQSVVWDSEFPKLILDHPDKWVRILSDYRRHTAGMWKGQRLL